MLDFKGNNTPSSNLEVNIIGRGNGPQNSMAVPLGWGLTPLRDRKQDKDKVVKK